MTTLPTVQGCSLEEIECGDCRFWRHSSSTPSAEYGECRRNAPQATLHFSGANRTYWPETADSDWCGEFQPKESNPQESVETIALRILQKRFPMCAPGETLLDMLDQINVQIMVLQEVTRELTYSDECWYDHHGYCQAHNLHERVCPHARAKEILPEPSPQE